MEAVLELAPLIRIWTEVVRPRWMSRSKPGSTRTTMSTLLESSRSCTSRSLEGSATTSNRPEPWKPASNSRLS